MNDNNSYDKDHKTDEDGRTIGTVSNLKKLDIQRRELETESSAIVHELTASPGPGIQPIGIDAPLVDAEGYPRADIDMYHATGLRKRLVEIQGDYKAVMGHIERGLLVSFGTAADNNASHNVATLADTVSVQCTASSVQCTTFVLHEYNI